MAPAKIHSLVLLGLAICFGGLAQAQQAPTKVANVAYGSVGQTLDLFVPAQTQPVKRTALLFIHGGGFKQGSKNDMAPFASLYAQGGFVAASMDYRLTADHHAYPAQIDDVEAAISWMKGQALTYGFDRRKIILIGYSAGGNLALMAGLKENSGIAAIASAAGPTDLAALVANSALPQLKIDIDAYMGGKSYDLGSPIFKVRAGNPPVLLFHGAQDDLVPLAQSQSLLQKLIANNVPASLHVLPNAKHEIMLALYGNPSLKPILDDLTRLAVVIELQP